LSEGEIQKLIELEKKENDEMNKKYKTVLEKHGVSIVLNVYRPVSVSFQ